MTRIICFGDSITFGFTDPEGGWTQRLHNQLANTYVTKESNPIHEVINLGISGDTADDLIERVDGELAARCNNRDGVVIIAIGVNDSAYNRNTSKNHTTAEKFEKKLKQVVTKCHEHTDKIVMLGLLPCDESKMQPMPWSTTGESCSNQRISTFNHSLANVAKAMDVHIVDMFADVMKLDYEKYLHDGLHPNSVGHQYIADRLKDKTAEYANNY